MCTRVVGGKIHNGKVDYHQFGGSVFREKTLSRRLCLEEEGRCSQKHKGCLQNVQMPARMADARPRESEVNSCLTSRCLPNGQMPAGVADACPGETEVCSKGNVVCIVGRPKLPSSTANEAIRMPRHARAVVLRGIAE